MSRMSHLGRQLRALERRLLKRLEEARTDPGTTQRGHAHAPHDRRTVRHFCRNLGPTGPRAGRWPAARTGLDGRDHHGRSARHEHHDDDASSGGHVAAADGPAAANHRVGGAETTIAGGYGLAAVGKF